MTFWSYSSSFSICRSDHFLSWWSIFFLGGAFSWSIVVEFVNWSDFLLRLSRWLDVFALDCERWVLSCVLPYVCFFEGTAKSRLLSSDSSKFDISSGWSKCDVSSGLSKFDISSLVISSSGLIDTEGLSWISMSYSLQNLRMLFDCCYLSLRKYT